MFKFFVFTFFVIPPFRVSSLPIVYMRIHTHVKKHSNVRTFHKKNKGYLRKRFLVSNSRKMAQKARKRKYSSVASSKPPPKRKAQRRNLKSTKKTRATKSEKSNTTKLPKAPNVPPKPPKEILCWNDFLEHQHVLNASSSTSVISPRVLIPNYFADGEPLYIV